MFSSVADYKKFKDMRLINFLAENGERMIMTYKTTVKSMQLPLLMDVQITNPSNYSFKISCTLN